MANCGTDNRRNRLRLGLRALPALPEEDARDRRDRVAYSGARGRLFQMTEPVTPRFARLTEEASACTLCPAMAGRMAVLSEKNGSLRPRVLFVAEAPGRRGGDRTRIPMSGDASGRTFRHLLALAGLTDDDIFITNAVLCSPRSETGANRKPSTLEIQNCGDFLRRTIDILDPPGVVSVGTTALAALSRIEPHSRSLAANVVQPAEWFGRLLIPVYHPSPQVIISRRSLAQQEDDWRMLGRFLSSAGILKPGANPIP